MVRVEPHHRHVCKVLAEVATHVQPLVRPTAEIQPTQVGKRTSDGPQCVRVELEFLQEQLLQSIGSAVKFLKRATDQDQLFQSLQAFKDRVQALTAADQLRMPVCITREALEAWE